MVPVLAQSTQENESRINELEEVLCILHPEVVATVNYSVCDVATQKEREEMVERQKSWDKDPYTYAPDGSARQSPEGEFRCVGFPEVLENPDEPKGVAYAKCKQKFGEAKGNTAPTPKKFFCAQFPEALNYQECTQKIRKAKDCKRNPSMC